MVHRKTIETIRRYYGGVDLRCVDMKAIGQIVGLKLKVVPNKFHQVTFDFSELHNSRYFYKGAPLTRIFSTKNRAFGVNYFPNPQYMQVMGNINYSHRMPQAPRVLGG